MSKDKPFVALIQTEDEAFTLYVGAYSTLEKADTKGREAADAANEKIAEAGSATDQFSPVTIPSDWEESVDNLVEAFLKTKPAKHEQK